MVVETMEQMHRQQELSYRELCAREGLGYASFMRWRQRCAAGEPPVGRPGPAKVETPDLAALREQVRALRHGRHRTGGTGALHAEHRDTISRRDLNRLVREERRRANRERDRLVHRVAWKVPRLIWAMDDTEYQPDPRYPKAYLHNVQDLGSRYKLPPLVTSTLADGARIAAHLESLFRDYGPPLFLKRDNGGNLNHGDIETLLESFLVIPLNSPCHYPKYNGGIERAQGEIKERINRHDDQPRAFLAIQAELDLEALNHRRRPALGNRSACDLFRDGRTLAQSYTRPRRKEAYDWIQNKTLDLIQQSCYDADMAWRLAAETWLLENGFITVSGNPNVLPHFPGKRSHH